MLQEEVSDATLSYLRLALASLLRETVLRMLKVSYMSRDNAQKWTITGGQNPSARGKRPRSSRACMHVVF